MTKANVLATVVNWRRPTNIPAVLAGLRAQTVPLHIAICECAPGTEFALPPDVLASADQVFTIRDNIGPSSRFVPALAMPGYRYTFFTTDDYVAGPKCLEHMIRAADFLQGKFATIGQEGRRVVGEDLSGRRIGKDTTPVPVDVITSYELAESKDLHHVMAFRDEMLAAHGDAVSLFEDDLFLCFALARAKGFPSYLTQHCDTVEESWRMRELPAPNALCARPDHRERRNLFVRQAKAIGWRCLSGS